MYSAKVQGTKYNCSLENDNSQWYVRIKLGDVVEGEVQVTHMTKRAIHGNLGSLFQKVNLNVNSFQHDMIHKEIVSQAIHLMAKEGKGEEATTHDEPYVDPRIDGLVDKVTKLEKTVSELLDRVNRLEALSNS
ncbi:MAG: hypothetical protein OEZ01_15645 [Candidatus Heimdallarchaeota archaeon]|nr:hypothetical protein [Candidatus Heimdallarchaeota archaeon]MDH5647443.1 hypothetical protein [Candidatus Heimdallarchaeota archaeon]